MIDNTEQNIIEPYSTFEVNVKADVKVNRWETTEKYDLLEAEHNGYNDISVTHRRQFLLDKVNNYYIIRDSLSGTGKHKVEAFFHVGSSVNPYFHKEIPAVVMLELSDSLLALIPVPLESFEAFMEQSWISYSYGTRVPGITIRYTITEQIPVNFSFLLCKLSSGDDIHQKIETCLRHI